MNQELEELLKLCTVKISISGKFSWGTGFFVAPGLILTCAHVVKVLNTNAKVKIRWQQQEDFIEAKVLLIKPTLDLALLQFTPPSNIDLPCVYLDETVQTGHELYCFGYPDQDFPNGCPVTAICEGFTGDLPPLIKFKLGQVRPGMSGSALLNCRTGKVCGIVKFTRDRSFDLGGGAISVKTIFTHFTDVQIQNRRFHQQNLTWYTLLSAITIARHHNREDHKNRQILLNKVRNSWIEGVLDNSLYDKARIELGLEKRFDVLELAYETPEVKSKCLPKGESIITQFDRLREGRSLLILGAPGSGKTTTLLELARVLIIRAEQDLSLPIPVVFNLASWTNPKQTLQNWIEQELYTKYQVSRALGKDWIQNQQLLLLLDGLDEVKLNFQKACIHAIKEFYQGFGETEIVVCSRFSDYENLRERFQFQVAIVLQPLTYQQVDNYLNQAGKKLETVRIAWQSDPVMQELARTPLMLSVMALAYEGLIEKLPQISLKERQDHLWEKYIERMYKRKRQNLPYSKDQLISWLGFLAQRMNHESQTIFLIERLQPSWFQDKAQRWFYFIWVALITGSTFQIAFGLTTGLLTSLSIELFTSLLMGLLFGAIIGCKKKVELFETLKWSWSWEQVWKLPVLGAIIGPALGVIFREASQLIGLSKNDLLISVIFGAQAGFIFGLVASFLRSFNGPSILRNTSPNQGIWKSATNATIFTTIFIPIIIGIAELWYSEKIFFVPVATLFSLVWLFTGGGALIQHFSIRLILQLGNLSPMNYAAFLSYGTDLMYIQQIGGGYTFIHKFLQEKFASKYHILKSSSDNLEKNRNYKLFLLTCPLIILLLIGIQLPSSLYSMRVVSDQAIAMTPNIKKGDYLLVDKLSYRLEKPDVGDMIVFSATNAFKQKGFNTGIRRIVGIPGEKVRIRNRNCNNELQKVPAMHYMVSGDNIDYKDCSTYGGIIPKSKLIGRVVLRYWPLKRFRFVN